MQYFTLILTVGGQN